MYLNFPYLLLLVVLVRIIIIIIIIKSEYSCLMLRT